MKKLLAFILSLILSVCAMATFTACGDDDGAGISDLDDIIARGKITMATEATFAPFESKNGTDFVGIDIDIAQAIADYIGVTLEVKDMAFDSVVTSVQKGQTDLAIAALTISEDRKKAINFSDAYFGAAQYVVVKANDTTFDGLTTKEEIDAKLATLSGNAAAQQATTGFYYIKGSSDFCFDGFSNLTPRAFDSAVLAAQAVANGQAKLAILDDEVAEQIVAQNTDVKVIRIALSSEEYGIGINKANTGLRLVVNKVLKQLKDSGELSQIIARHTGD